MRTRLTERLGIELPIISAPMGFLAGGRLAAAVSSAGGLGLIGGGYGDRDWLDRAFAAAGNIQVGCGFITWSLAKQPELLDQVLARSPTALMLSFGSPSPFAARIRQSGATLICQVQSMANAREAVDAGADVIVAQGTEGGGHVGWMASMAVLPMIVDAAGSTPVMAAGGFADGRGLAAALALGAQGVLLGTRFLATKESPLHPHFKQAVLDSDGHDTVLTEIPDIARATVWPGAMARSRRNAFIERWAGREWELRARQPEAAAALQQAMETGDADNAALLIGQDAGLIRDIPPAGEIVERIVIEAEALLRDRLPRLCR